MAATNRYTSQKLYIALSALWWVLTTILLVLPGNALPKTRIDLIPNFDKLVHFFLFALLAGLLLKAQKKVTIYNCLRIAALTLAYGIAMEYVQKYWVPHRSFDVVDIWADGLGAMAGVVLVAWLSSQRNANTKG